MYGGVTLPLRPLPDQVGKYGLHDATDPATGRSGKRLEMPLTLGPHRAGKDKDGETRKPLGGDSKGRGSKARGSGTRANADKEQGALRPGQRGPKARGTKARDTEARGNGARWTEGEGHQGACVCRHLDMGKLRGGAKGCWQWSMGGTRRSKRECGGEGTTHRRTTKGGSGGQCAELCCTLTVRCACCAGNAATVLDFVVHPDTVVFAHSSTHAMGALVESVSC